MVFAWKRVCPTAVWMNNLVSAPADASNDVFQLIEAHQSRASRLAPVQEVKTFLCHSLRGVLSTVSMKHGGYASGSMVDFACDAYGTPILAVSDLAVHTKNLMANPKCSLLVAKDLQDQTDLVITLYGDAVPVHEKRREGIRAMYLGHHPNAVWVDFGDFQFLRIEPMVVQYVSGVATALLGSGEFSAEEFRTAVVDPVYRFSKPITAGDTFKLRIPFPRRAADRKDVKTIIVEMLQAAKASKANRLNS